MSVRAAVGDQPVNVRLPADLHAEIIQRSEQEDRTLAATIRTALRFYLANTTPLAPPPAPVPVHLETP